LSFLTTFSSALEVEDRPTTGERHRGMATVITPGLSRCHSIRLQETNSGQRRLMLKENRACLVLDRPVTSRIRRRQEHKLVGRILIRLENWLSNMSEETGGPTSPKSKHSRR
jgi:hypothetical protein